MHERDLLIQGGSHQYSNGTISFIPHNRAWNNRAAMMTHEVWLMMLGLNLDLWTQPLVEKAVAKFGKLLVWEEDHYHMARAIVKVRVAVLRRYRGFLFSLKVPALSRTVGRCSVRFSR